MRDMRKITNAEEITLDAISAVAEEAVAGLTGYYQRLVYDRIVSERYEEKNLPQAQQQAYLREREQEITFHGCECLQEISGGRRDPNPTRLFEFKFSDYTPGTTPLPDMRILLQLASGVERFLLYRGHRDNRVTVEIEMKSHLSCEMKYLCAGDTVEFLLPCQVGGKAIKRFRYMSKDARHLPADEAAIFETPDGGVRCTIQGWKQRLFWIAARERINLHAHGCSVNNKKKAGAATR